VKKSSFLFAEHGNVPDLFRIIHGALFFCFCPFGVFAIVSIVAQGNALGMMASGLSGRLFFDELVVGA
jgi:hypothetical protein